MMEIVLCSLRQRHEKVRREFLGAIKGTKFYVLSSRHCGSLSLSKLKKAIPFLSLWQFDFFSKRESRVSFISSSDKQLYEAAELGVPGAATGKDQHIPQTKMLPVSMPCVTAETFLGVTLKKPWMPYGVALQTLSLGTKLLLSSN
jgi:hypothetical protein